MSAPDLPPPPLHAMRAPALHVHLHADRVQPEDLEGGIAIVIDAIRASVTIAHALAQGARRIVPVLTADDARAKAKELLATRERDQSRAGPILLGGERGGVLIEGFDLDNSPFTYTSQRVRDATIVFTTSNGTAGLLHARRAARVLVGSFVNLAAIVDAVANDPRPVHVIACGTRRDISLDDVLVAGAFASRLIQRGRATPSDDSWQVATHLWDRINAGGFEGIVRAMSESRGGRNMVTLGLARDVAYCSTIDAVPVVPVFDAQRGDIRLET